MNYSFHPAAEAEFLESVGYYESKVPGLGGAFMEEFEALASLIGESPKAWQVELQPDFTGLLCTDFRSPSFTAKNPAVFRYWRSPMTGDVRSTGLADFNTPYYPLAARFSADTATAAFQTSA